MKKITFLFLSSLISFILATPLSAQNLSERLQWACDMMDAGDYEGSRASLELLLAESPDNEYILYELALCKYLDNKSDEAKKILEKLYDSETAQPGVFSLYGSILDYEGKAEEARQVLQAGIEKYPDVGNLYHGMGITYLREYDLTNALDWFYKGIEAAPTHASNYSKAANILYSAKKDLPTILMLDALFLLEPGSERSSAGGKAIGEILAEKITVSTDSAGKRNVKILLDGKNILTPTDFPKMSMLYSLAVASSVNDSTSLSTIAAVAEARGKAIDLMSEFADKYDIISYLRKIREAGHWEAFNYLQLLDYGRDEAVEWINANNQKAMEFATWFSQNEYKPDPNRTTAGLFPASMINLAFQLESPD